MAMLPIRCFTFWCLGLAFLVGCGDSASVDVPLFPAKGKLTYQDGTPLPPGGTVELVAEGESKYSTFGEVGQGGTFELSTGHVEAESGERQSGAPAGNYKVVVVYDMMGALPDPNAIGGEDTEAPAEPAESPMPTSPVAPKYSDPTTTDLTVEVKEGDNNFDLKVSK